MDLDPAFLHAVETRARACLGVTIIGDISRTWYLDRDLLVELLDSLWLDEGMYVSIHGDVGFGLMVEETVLGMGMGVLSNFREEPYTEPDMRYGWRTTHAYDLYAETVAVVVMTRRNLPQEVWEVDPHVIDSAVQHEMPVFALNEEGILWSWP